MLTTLSFQRRQLLQGSLLLSIALLLANIVTSLYLIIHLYPQNEVELLQNNVQQQNLEKAIEIVEEQTL
jgi:hypothetical protein